MPNVTTKSDKTMELVTNVLTNVNLVPTLLNVLIVLITLSELITPIVHVKTDISMTRKTQSVRNVTTNVPLVPKNQNVELVNLTELTPHLVSAQKDNMMMEPLNVNLVTKNVLNVLNHQKTVPNVPKKELNQNHTVHVQTNNTNTKNNVNLVNSNVELVKRTPNLVPLVNTLDLQSHLVSVQEDISLKTKNQNVSNVTTNVSLVPELPTPVLFVLKEESTSQLVIAQKENLITRKPNVENVTSTVEPVKDLLITVLIVLKTESLNQNVNVHSKKDTSKTKVKLNVQNVTTNV
jgi:hypothetical protein